MVWNFDPVLLELGPFRIYYYGLCFALGLLCTFFLTRTLMQKKGYSIEDLDSLAFYLIVGTVLGARLGHALFYSFEYFSSHPLEILFVWKGGLSSHGGILGVLLAYLLFLRVHRKYHFFDLADLLCVSTPFMIFFVRLGNFFNSEILGLPTELPWGIVFQRVGQTESVHPSQLYEMLLGAALLIFMNVLWNKKHKSAKPGLFFGLFFILYFSGRFFLEFFKDLAIHPSLWNLTTGQFLSLPFILLGVGILVKGRMVPGAGIEPALR